MRQPDKGVPTTGSRVTTDRGEALELGKLIKSGGAGSVYLLPGAPALVAKIYHASTDPGQHYERKIRAMLEFAPDLPDYDEGDTHVIQIAWPRSALRDARGSFCGFLMPLLDIKATVELEYILQERQAREAGLPVGLGTRITLAANASALVAQLHQQRHYVVDLKPVNIRFYRRSFHLAMLDCDGFSIYSDGERFPAQQYTADYLAPEFHQGQQVAGAEMAQDRFALAVIIFQLLNFGIHPYTGRPAGRNVPTDVPGRIARNCYAYGLRPNADIQPNPGSGHEQFPHELRELFDRAFARNSALRPSAADWAAWLGEHARRASGKIVVCSRNREHQHFAGMQCMACAREALLAKTSSDQKKATAQARKKARVAAPVQAVPGTQPVAAPQASSGGMGGFLSIVAIIVVFWIILAGSCSGNRSRPVVPTRVDDMRTQYEAKVRASATASREVIDRLLADAAAGKADDARSDLDALIALPPAASDGNRRAAFDALSNYRKSLAGPATVEKEENSFQFIEEANKAAPNHPSILSEVGMAQMLHFGLKGISNQNDPAVRAGWEATQRNYYAAVAADPETYAHWRGLGMACVVLGQDDCAVGAFTVRQMLIGRLAEKDAAESSPAGSHSGLELQDVRLKYCEWYFPQYRKKRLAILMARAAVTAERFGGPKATGDEHKLATTPLPEAKDDDARTEEPSTKASAAAPAKKRKPSAHPAG